MSVKGLDPREEAYVREQLAVTVAQLKSGQIKAHDDEAALLRRCEAYARWRWRGFHDKTIASL